MTYLDAARVLIAHIIDENPGRASSGSVRDFGSLPLSLSVTHCESEDFTLKALVPDADTGTFEQALAALVRVFAECRGDMRVIRAGTRLRDGGWLKPVCRVELQPRDRFAFIEMAGTRYDFGELTNARDAGADRDERTRLGRQSTCFVNQEVIATIADGFMGERADL